MSLRITKTSYPYTRAASPPLTFSSSISPPKVAVVDEFDRKTVDIDGDSIPDLSHGETVRRLIKAFCPKARIHQYNLAFNGQEHAEASRLGVIQQLVTIADYNQRKGIRPYDALNLSIGPDFFYSEILQDDKPFITPNNLASFSDMLINWAYQNSPTRYQLLEVLDRIIHQTALYMPSGNKGARAFNFNSILEGQTTIGATNSRGQTTPYSSENDLVIRREQGTFGITRVKGGFDISGDGKVDVFTHEVSGGQSFVERFSGKLYDDLRLKSEDILYIQNELKSGKPFSEIDLIYERVFSMEQINRPTDEKALRVSGPELAIFQRIISNGKSTAILKSGFTVDKATRKVIYDPDESGRPNQMNALYGTSFASPVALGKDLAARTHTGAAGNTHPA